MTCEYAGDESVRRIWVRLKQHESGQDILNDHRIWPIVRVVARNFTMPLTYIPGDMENNGQATGPVLFPSSTCWTSMGPPSDADVFQFTIPKTVITASGDQLPSDKHTFNILRQVTFGDHRPNEVMGGLNCSPTALTVRNPFHIPGWLMKRYTDVISDVTLDITPIFMAVDAHCGMFNPRHSRMAPCTDVF